MFLSHSLTVNKCTSCNLCPPQLTDYSNGTFTGVASLPWEALGPEVAPVNIGLTFSSYTPSFVPSTFSVSGVGE